MKKVIVVITLALFATVGKAQTFDEWFKQKKTQKKYLIEQIAAFQMYLGYVQRGYSIAQNGLLTITNIKKGDFNLHSDFFSSLRTLNAISRQYPQIADIVAYQIKTFEVYQHTYKQVQMSNLFNVEDVNYIFKVFTNLLSNCTDIIDELIAVTTDGTLEMKDDERLKRIDALHTSMQDNYTFAKSLGEETKVLVVQRMKEKNDVQTSRLLTGIKNK